MALISSADQWTQKYAILPYKTAGRDWQGVDCWGLVFLIYLTELGIQLPLYSLYDTIPKDASVDKMVNRFRDDWILYDKPFSFSIILFNFLGKCCHMGVMLDDDRFIHCRQQTNVSIESVSRLIWRNRVEGYYGFRNL